MNTKKMTKPELIKALDAIIQVIERGPKVSEPDSAVNRVYNLEVWRDELRAVAGVEL